MSTLRVSNIEAKADPSSPSVDEKLKVTNSNGDILVHIDGKTAGVTTIGINTTGSCFTVDAAQNVEFLGIVTATKFSLSGGGEITGGDGNFTGIVTSGSGNFTGGLSVGTAVTAATANFTSSLTAASANFTGNVSIAGTLTYEDVTNVDSVGIATARTGIDVTGGHIDLVDDSKIRFGTGDDLEIEHDTSQAEDVNMIKSASNLQLQIRADKLRIIDTDATQDLIHADVDSSAKLFYAGSKKLETISSGAKITGVLEVTQEYPSIRPTLDLNFAATKTLDRRITFTRDSLGTYIDDMGIVKYASNNTPRFDHDPATGESLGLLIEESRTNILTYSDITSGEGVGTGWAIGGSRASKGSNATAPDGTLSAWNSVYNGTSGDASLYKVGGEITTSNSTAYTLSIFAKVPSTNTYITGVRIRTYNDNHSAQFNLITGTIIGTSEGTTTQRMEAYPNGWYRCSITFTSGTDGNQGVQFYMMNSSNNTLLNDSNASGEEIYYWGAQMEAGAFPTSYIPTSGSTVTRAQDFAKITGTNFTDFYNQSEGTLVCDQSISDLTTANQYSVIFSSNVNESIGMGYRVGGGASGGYGFYIIKSGDALFRNVASVVSADTPIRTALAYKLNDGATVVNGESAVNDTSLVLPTPDRMLIGEGYSANNELKKGHIRKISYYNKRLPNAQLQGLTQQ